MMVSMSEPRGDGDRVTVVVPRAALEELRAAVEAAAEPAKLDQAETLRLLREHRGTPPADAMAWARAALTDSNSGQVTASAGS
jgi:hypothetical protein